MKYPSVLVALALLAALPASAIAYRLLPEERLAEVVQVRALRYGDTGEAVAALQELLHARGFDPGPVDGIFGPLTEAAVKAAQRHFGLEVDGLAGRLTIGALRAQVPTGARAGADSDGTGAWGEDLDAGSTQVGESVSRAQAAAGRPPRVSIDRADAGDSRPTTTAVGTTQEGARANAGTVLPADGAEGPGPIRAESGLLIYQAASGDQSGVAPAAPAGEVALTFHHLPAPEALDALLALLEEAEVHATFFVTGEEALARPADLRRIRSAGHAIGSLGYREVDMRRMSPADAREELRRASQAIRDAAGAAPELFRPPLGRFDRRLVALAEEEGMRVLLWSNAALFLEPDTRPQRLAELAGRALYSGAVLMLPLDEPAGRAAVAPLLDRARAAGYRVAPLERIEPPKGVALSTITAR